MSPSDVKAIRTRMGLGRKEFAALLPASSRTVRRWENDEVDPSPLAVQQLQRLIEAFEEAPADEPASPRRRALDVVVK